MRRITSRSRRIPPRVSTSSVRITAQQHIYNREMSQDTHEPLRDDVHLLGDLLGRTLSERAGEDLLHTVERVRALAKSRRHRGAKDVDELGELLRSMRVEDSVPV